ncbi:MAG: hypothetical protein NTW62_03040 [Candidatus Nomurabacteria bacterium]|nr:hypothetical protein [Candidatus Nomurabacteria bacterium]
MKKARTFLIIGIWVAILPYLGFPYSWKQIISTLTGLGIMYFAYMIYKKEKLDMKNVESANFDTSSEYRNDDYAQDNFRPRI